MSICSIINPKLGCVIGILVAGVMVGSIILAIFIVKFVKRNGGEE